MMRKPIFIITLLNLISAIAAATGNQPQAARSILVNCHNRTGVSVQLISWHLTHGIVSHHDEQNRDLLPPNLIPAGANVQWATESNGIMTGTEGDVTYQFQDNSGSSFYFHWNNAYASNAYGTHYNTFNESISKGYTLFISGNHRDFNEVVDLYIDYPKTVIVPGFLPSKNAFKFINSWADFTYQIPWFSNNPVLSYLFDGHAKNGLCGGMVYTVRDYFEKKQLIPQMPANPNDADHPVTKYIIKRLFESFTAGDISMYVKLMSPMYADTDDGSLNWLGQMGRAYITLREEWPMIKQDIDNGHPAPIGLIHVNSAFLGDLGKNHQVMVYGYTLNSDYIDLRVYDPNKGPDDHIVLRIKLQGTDKPLDVNYNGSDRPVYALFRTNYELNPSTPGYSFYTPLPKILISGAGSSIVTSTIFWTAKTGRPKTDNINSAFTVKVTVPKYFQPVRESLPGSLETYLGQQGYFTESQTSGEARIELIKQPLTGESVITTNQPSPGQPSMAPDPRNDPGAAGVMTIKRASADEQAARGTITNRETEPGAAGKMSVATTGGVIEQAAGNSVTRREEDGWIYKITVSGLPPDLPFILTIECTGQQGWEPGPGNVKPEGYKNHIYVVEVNPDRNYTSGHTSPGSGSVNTAGFECIGDWRNFSIPVRQVEVVNPVIQKKNQTTVQKIKNALPAIIKQQ